MELNKFGGFSLNVAAGLDIEELLRNAHDLGACCRCGKSMDPRYDPWAVLAQPFARARDWPVATLCGGMFCEECHGEFVEFLTAGRDKR